MSLFGALNTANSGLKVSQTATDIISNNIANAENEFYTRQRVNIAQMSTIKNSKADIGTGAIVEEVIRVHNEFTFARYRDSSANLQYNSYQQTVMEEISKYFPEVNELGLQRDIGNYFDAWQKFGSNPSDASQKVALAQTTITLSKNMNDIRERMSDMQDYLNEQLISSVNEVNRLAEKIATINKEITQIEVTDYLHANALRDERDQLEYAIYELVAPTVNKMGTKSFVETDINHADYSETYSMELGGYPLVDGDSFHKLEITASNGETGNLRSVFFVSSDASLKDITPGIKNGKVGAILDLRGRTFNYELGQPKDGIIQQYVDGLDVISRTIIQQTNNIYAKSADTYMYSNQIGSSISLTASDSQLILADLIEKKYNKKVQQADMVISTYDLTGKINQGDIKINIDPTTKTMEQIIQQINTEFATRNINAEAVLELGTLAIKPGGTNGTQTVSAVLIKEDNTLITDALAITGSKSLKTVDNIDIPFDILNGTFEIGLFDSYGNLQATRTITIDKTNKDPLYSSLNGIAAQINMPYIDDDDDNDYSNDVDDMIEAGFSNDHFTIKTKNDEVGAYFNIIDHGTGFAGAIGLHKFFEGDSAKTIRLNTAYENNPPEINAYSNPVDGNNEVANDIQQMQYDDVPFFNVDGTTVWDTIAGGYRYYAGKMAEETHAIGLATSTYTAVHTSIKEQNDSLSRVSIDEELTNLMKFQTGYGANAKVITTIQQMLDTLLTLKQ